MNNWNRCDICGKFISFTEFDAGEAERYLVTPDSDYSSEEYETYHIKCKKGDVSRCLSVKQMPKL